MRRLPCEVAFTLRSERSVCSVRQLERLADEGKQVDCIEQAVEGAIDNLKGRSGISA